MAQKSSRSDDDVIIVKKYANRRLYNTATSSYVTLENLCRMVKDGKEFTVRDAKTGKDITGSVLTQIIFEEEGKGQNLLPIRFLRQLIRFYGDNMQTLVPSYLQMSMDMLSREQSRLKERLSNAFGGREQLGQFEEQIRQNFSKFENALRTLSPFGSRASTPERGTRNTPEIAAVPEPKKDDPENNDQLDELKRQLTRMQAQIDALTSVKKKNET